VIGFLFAGTAQALERYLASFRDSFLTERPARM